MSAAGAPQACTACGQPMRRLYTGQAFIIRPTGWALRPGDRGYSDFRRERELGELRGPSEREGAFGDASYSDESPLDALTADDYTLPDAVLRELHQAGTVADRIIREEMRDVEFQERTP